MDDGDTRAPRRGVARTAASIIFRLIGTVVVVVSVGLMFFPQARAGWNPLDSLGGVGVAASVSPLPGAGIAAPASPEVMSLVDRAALSEEGRQIYGSASPAIETAAEFNANCPPDAPGEGFLGCFDGRRIHLFEVREPEWEGSMVSTGVHEMLHAAWQRLPDSERERLSPLLIAASDAARVEPRVESVIESEMRHYNVTSVTSPEMVNELHSILGSQVVGLPPELESYYARYFADRSVVVAIDIASSSTYYGLLARIDELAATVGRLDTQFTDFSTRWDSVTQCYSIAAADYNGWVAENPLAPMAEIEARRRPVQDCIDEQASISVAQQVVIDQRRVASDEWTSCAAEANRLWALLDSTAG
ncbi:hypothetical protein [Agreia sp. COWG]|uniref:hypothetical protein n=1 Tax=Agreia sp. COWG TaxID=2773266 RepID=UPI0019253643|nr:hypothetical protein [Agreia sp. COWG]CAD6001158.1 conserved protein of unknown function [Agreia sp. COWG]